MLDFVRQRRTTHPADLEARFGSERAVNGWGGFSKATTRALHSLHYHGLLRVARRRDGIRVYQAASPHPEPLTPAERSQRLVLLVTRILAPVPAASLGATFGLLRRGAPGIKDWGRAVQALLASGEIESGDVDGVKYLWPAETRRVERDQEPAVRLLAPFDPVVWDRRRFEHLWGWPYRFEAYTKPAKRQLGYYAMPLLWRDRVIGWGNVAVKDGALEAEFGSVAPASGERAFRRELEIELERMRGFLGVSDTLK